MIEPSEKNHTQKLHSRQEIIELGSTEQNKRKTEESTKNKNVGKTKEASMPTSGVKIILDVTKIIGIVYVECKEDNSKYI